MITKREFTKEELLKLIYQCREGLWSVYEAIEDEGIWDAYFQASLVFNELKSDLLTERRHLIH